MSRNATIFTRSRNPAHELNTPSNVNPSVFPRCSGILLHVTSLPEGQGIGDLGQAAHDFVEFLAAAGQKIWQVLPLGPTGYGDSPYQLFSAFAGNPLLIDLKSLQEQGLLSAQDLVAASDLPEDHVEYGRVIEVKQALLGKAAYAFFSGNTKDRDIFNAFCSENAEWLDDYALFMACKSTFKNGVWSDWDRGIRKREPSALKEYRERLAPQIDVHKFAQFEFFRQWESLKAHCKRYGINVMGDVPIYVAHDSADVWSYPELFRLDEQSKPAAIAGVPPDYFSSTGQLWGNPLYRWDVSVASGHQWWIKRFRASLKLFDMVRLDHFRGFEAFCAREISGRRFNCAGR